MENETMWKEESEREREANEKGIKKGAVCSMLMFIRLCSLLLARFEPLRYINYYYFIFSFSFHFLLHTFPHFPTQISELNIYGEMSK
jgi:hypothetical protein